MSAIAWDTLTEPLSEEAPCGPDLDMEGDPTFMNFMARAEGLLPQSFLTVGDDGRHIVFDRANLPYAEDSRTIAGFLGETRDLRLLVILAKFAVLSRDLPTFAQTLEGIARLLATRWLEVHPQGDGGDFIMRLVTLQSLDDTPTVVMPLQYVPLVMSRRAGNISFRSLQLALGEAVPGEGEESADASAIEAALEETELDGLVALRDTLTTARAAVESCQAIWLEKVGYTDALTFPQLLPVLTRMERWIDGAIGRRDPAARTSSGEVESATAGGGKPATDAGAEGALTSAEEATRALAAASAYFARHEPASPALLLVRQAEALVGRPFYEILSTLMPERFDSAKIPVASDIGIALPLSSFASLGLPDLSADESQSTDSSDWGSSSSSWESEAPSEASGEDGEAVADGAEAEDGQEQRRNEITPASPPEPRRFRAASRAECLALLTSISRFYRSAEPASPIPLLVDRAAALASRDFASLLKDFLPREE
jgi:type VI secretion system protein ImpA